MCTVAGDGCDEYPRNQKNAAIEGSLPNRLEFGAACSPERQFPYLSVDSKETGFATGTALRKTCFVGHFLENLFSKAAEKGPPELHAPPKPKIEADEAQAITSTTVAQENTAERN